MHSVEPAEDEAIAKRLAEVTCKLKLLEGSKHLFSIEEWTQLYQEMKSLQRRLVDDESE